MRDQITEAALGAASVGNKATLAGGGIAGLGWAASSEFVGLCGVAIALAGLLINLHFRRKADRREQAFHDAAMARTAVEMERQLAEIRRLDAGMPVTPRVDTGD